LWAARFIVFAALQRELNRLKFNLPLQIVNCKNIIVAKSPNPDLEKNRLFVVLAIDSGIAPWPAKGRPRAGTWNLRANLVEKCETAFGI
jgi:hypothetical protein